MKFVVYVALAASLFAIAAAVTRTSYSDAACKTAVPSSATSPNPFVSTLNACTKYIDGVYVKATACGGGKVTSGTYSDDKCATVSSPASASDTDTCEPGGGGSAMVTCASTSSVTMAFLAVAAAVLALSF
jgi:hypothetical protein